MFKMRKVLYVLILGLVGIISLAFAVPSSSSMYQLTLVKVLSVLTGTKDSAHIVDGSGNCRLLTSGDISSGSLTQITLVNSTVYPLTGTDGHYGQWKCWGNNGEYAYVRITPTVAVLEQGSVDFIISSSPTGSVIGVNITTGNLTLVTGSGITAHNISYVFEGM